MKVFRSRLSERHQRVTLEEGQELALFEVYEGERDSAVPVRLQVQHQDQGRQLEEADVFESEPVLVMTVEAWKRCSRVLSPFGHLVPVECEDADLVAFTVTTVLDALDHDHAEVSDFGLDRPVFLVDRWAFYAERLPERSVFHLPVAGEGASILATGSVVADLDALGLRGLWWELVWDEEASSRGCARG